MMTTRTFCNSYKRKTRKKDDIIDHVFKMLPLGNTH